MGLLSFSGVHAQEGKPDEITVKITRNGEVIKDTTYLTKNGEDLGHSLEMIDLILGEIHSGHHSKTMAFTTEDGKVIHIESEKKHVMVRDKEGAKEEIIIREGDGKKEKIIIMKDGELIQSGSPDAQVETFEDADGNSFVFIQKGDGDEEFEGDVEIKMESSGNYRFETEDGKVYYIRSKEKDGETKLEVEVIGKETKEDEHSKEKTREKK